MQQLFQRQEIITATDRFDDDSAGIARRSEEARAHRGDDAREPVVRQLLRAVARSRPARRIPRADDRQPEPDGSHRARDRAVPQSELLRDRRPRARMDCGAQAGERREDGRLHRDQRHEGRSHRQAHDGVLHRRRTPLLLRARQDLRHRRSVLRVVARRDRTQPLLPRRGHIVRSHQQHAADRATSGHSAPCSRNSTRRT